MDGPTHQEEGMKFVIVTTRLPFGSAKDAEDAARRFLELFAKWTPAASTTIHQLVTRVDAGGGFAVVETDSLADLLDATSKFGVFTDYQIYPVVDTADAIPVAQEAIKFRSSVS
jgi:uncharacterized protein DUF3303